MSEKMIGQKFCRVASALYLLKPCAAFTLSLASVLGIALQAQTGNPATQYKIYAGNTHSHTQFTWSHGEQWQHGCAGILVYGPKADDPFVSQWRHGYVFKDCPAIYVVNGWQLPGAGHGPEKRLADAAGTSGAALSSGRGTWL